MQRPTGDEMFGPLNIITDEDGNPTLCDWYMMKQDVLSLIRLSDKSKEQQDHDFYLACKRIDLTFFRERIKK